MNTDPRPHTEPADDGPTIAHCGQLVADADIPQHLATCAECQRCDALMAEDGELFYGGDPS